jgi:hypothetical protein
VGGEALLVEVALLLAISTPERVFFNFDMFLVRGVADPRLCCSLAVLLFVGMTSYSPGLPLYAWGIGPVKPFDNAINPA